MAKMPLKREQNVTSENKFEFLPPLKPIDKFFRVRKYPAPVDLSLNKKARIDFNLNQQTTLVGHNHCRHSSSRGNSCPLAINNTYNLRSNPKKCIPDNQNNRNISPLLNTQSRQVGLAGYSYVPPQTNLNKENDTNTNEETSTCEDSDSELEVLRNNKNNLINYKKNIPERDQAMYPLSFDQNRQENMPAQHTLQEHMDRLYCPCSNEENPGEYPGYRPPILAQPQPMPSPSYLQHYRYTQLHVNQTYNIPLSPPMPPYLIQNLNLSPQFTADLAFGPPPRDRRNLDSHHYEEQNHCIDRTKIENRNSSLQCTTLRENQYGSSNSIEQIQEMLKSLTPAQVADMSTENYMKYLDRGCYIGESIAKRNEHRPCFKNIQNLCSRTRSEVIKPNITVSNIHSQDVPWATKDFIFAFVGAINCWCILRGYLGGKGSNLGKIDREISPEFLACYSKWEESTKQLTHFLIQTFGKLDEANSSSNLNLSNSQAHSNPGPSTSTTNISLSQPKSTSHLREMPRKITQILTATATPSIDKKVSNTLKGIPWIFHIPSTTSAEIGDAGNPTSHTHGELSPKDEDSENENCVYMKPGSYTVPTKHQASQSNTNSPRYIEFFDTARIDDIYLRIMSAEKSDSYTSDLRDKVWKTSQSVTPDFIKQNEESSISSTINDNDVTLQKNKQIECWLNNDRNIFDSTFQEEDEGLQQPGDKLLLGITGSEFGAISETSKNRQVSKSSYRRSLSDISENETEGLTTTSLNDLERICHAY